MILKKCLINFYRGRRKKKNIKFRRLSAQHKCRKFTYIVNV